MTGEPDLSIIIVTLRDEIIPLEYFEASDFDNYEIIIRRDSGISKARNKGIKEASSDKIVFIDDDAKPCKCYLTIASRLLDQHPAITGRVIQPSTALSSGWNFNIYDQGNQAKKTNLLVGCNMGFQRKILETVGGFDERFDYGNEEVELAERIYSNYYIYYEPELCVKHAFADSRRSFWWKEYQKGKSDIKWLEKKGQDKRKQAQILLSYSGLRNLTYFIGNLFRKVGQISELI